MTNSKEEYAASALRGIAVIAIYFIMANLQGLPFAIWGIDPNTINIQVKIFYLISYELLMIAIIMMIFHKTLEQNFQDLKKNHKEYFSKYFKYWLFSVGIMMVANWIIALLSNGGVPGNEEIIRNNFQISPLYVYLSAVFFAPIVEELVFRQGIRNIIPFDTLFILISGIVFGGLHVVTSMTSAFDLLYLIPYCAPGFAFAYMLSKTDNIFVSMGLHCMHNGILISLQFLLLFFA